MSLRTSCSAARHRAGEPFEVGARTLSPRCKMVNCLTFEWLLLSETATHDFEDGAAQSAALCAACSSAQNALQQACMSSPSPSTGCHSARTRPPRCACRAGRREGTAWPWLRFQAGTRHSNGALAAPHCCTAPSCWTALSAGHEGMLNGALAAPHCCTAPSFLLDRPFYRVQRKTGPASKGMGMTIESAPPASRHCVWPDNPFLLPDGQTGPALKGRGTISRELHQRLSAAVRHQPLEQA